MSIETIIGIGVGVASVATSAYTILSQPSRPKNIPTATDQAAKEAAYAQAEQLRKRRAASSTFAAGPEGVTTPATVSKTILG